MAVQLQSLPEVERLSQRCIRILGGNPGKFTLQGTNTYLIGTGKRRILLDTGEGRPSWAALLRDILKNEDATVETVLLSHWHHDHVGGVDDVLRMCPEATVYKNNAAAGQSELSDGHVFQVDGATLNAVHTPGHTTDHIAFVLVEEDAMFTADNVLGQGTAVFEDMATYLASLRKMHSLFQGRAYPGHGPVIEEGPARISEYIRHRKQREDQVLQTMSGRGLSEQRWTVMDVVKVIYRDVPQELHLPASSGISQILRKLESEGKVQSHGDGWVLKNRSTL
jgi:ribonuclease/clavin/mitogillin